MRTAELQDLTGLKPGQPFDVGANREAAVRIEDRYRELGYPSVRVMLMKGEQAEDRDVIFVIEEGFYVAELEGTSGIDIVLAPRAELQKKIAVLREAAEQLKAAGLDSEARLLERQATMEKQKLEALELKQRYTQNEERQQKLAAESERFRRWVLSNADEKWHRAHAGIEQRMITQCADCHKMPGSDDTPAATLRSALGEIRDQVQALRGDVRQLRELLEKKPAPKEQEQGKVIPQGASNGDVFLPVQASTPWLGPQKVPFVRLEDLEKLRETNKQAESGQQLLE